MTRPVANNDPELAALMVRHLSEIDGAASHITHSLEPMLDNAIVAVMDDWCKKANWFGHIKWSDDETLWVAPENWKVPNTQDEYFWYLSFGYEETDDWAADRDYYRITRMLNVGSNKIGVVLECDYKAFGGMVVWRRFLETNFEVFQRLGFHFQKKYATAFRHIWLPHESIATAIESDTLNEAVLPIAEVFDEIKNALPQLNALFEKAKKELKPKT